MSIFERQVALKPDHYPWAIDYIRPMWVGHWTPDEFTFSSDYQDWMSNDPNGLNSEDKKIITKCMSGLAQIEVAVKTFWSKLGDNLPHPSLRDLGAVFAAIEVIHNRAYSRLLERLGLDEEITNYVKNEPVLRDRLNYLIKYLERPYTQDDRKQYLYSIILFTLFIENVSLFSQFYLIQWYNRNRNVLKDTAKQTGYTRREELIHALAGFKIINTIRKEHPELFDEDLKQRVLQEAQVAYTSECNLIDWMLGDYEDDELSGDILKQFVAVRLNESLNQIGYAKLFHEDSDLCDQFEWFEVEMKGGESTDFFHTRPTEYMRNAFAIEGV